MKSKGEETPMLEAHRLGKPNEAGLILSKCPVYFPWLNIREKIFLFGQPKPFKLYQKKPIQYTKCIKLGQVFKTESQPKPHVMSVFKSTHTHPAVLSLNVPIAKEIIIHLT